MSGRYRFVLVEDPGVSLPVRYHRAEPESHPVWVRRADPLEVLLEAFWRLSRRGEGELAWAPALAADPLTFLLDAIGDAVILREAGGRLMYANPAARRLPLPGCGHSGEVETLELGGRRYERRCMSFEQGSQHAGPRGAAPRGVMR